MNTISFTFSITLHNELILVRKLSLADTSFVQICIIMAKIIKNTHCACYARYHYKYQQNVALIDYNYRATKYKIIFSSFCTILR